MRPYYLTKRIGLKPIEFCTKKYDLQENSFLKTTLAFCIIPKLEVSFVNTKSRFRNMDES